MSLHFGKVPPASWWRMDWKETRVKQKGSEAIAGPRGELWEVCTRQRWRWREGVDLRSAEEEPSSGLSIRERGMSRVKCRVGLVLNGGGHLLRRGHRERLRSWVHEVHLDGWFELSLRCTCGDAKALECRGGVGGRKESEWLLSADSVGSPRLTAARGEARARAWA